MASKSRKKQADPVFTLIPRKKLLALYAALIQCRLLEEAFAGATRRRSRRMPGREAAAVAVAIDMRADDTLVAPARDPLPGFVRAPKRDAASAGMRKQAAEKEPSPAAQLRAALAAARQYQREQKQKIVAVFAADAWTKSAAWRAALQAAGDERLPMIFVAPGAAKTSHGTKLSFPSIPVDRDDVVALYRVASESIAHARRGNGATLIECIAWDLPVPDGQDAVAKMERYLAQVGIPVGRTRQRVASEFQRRLGTAACSST
ncbi:MAG: hypothetical protein ACLGP3_00215 [Acidobacteriota bacterium]